MTGRSTAEDRWHRFRTARDAALAEPHGWLSLTSLQWLGPEPARVDEVPGLWSAESSLARVTATPDDGLTDLTTDEPLTGSATATLEDEESLLWVAHGGRDGRRTVVELARRGGRYALRTRDSDAPTLGRFTGVPVFDHRDDVVVPARLERYDAPRREEIRTAHPAVHGVHVSVGEVVFQLPGDPREHRLRVAEEDGGRLGITFHDDTNGRSTADWRKVTTGVVRADGSVEIDFNRTVNYPSAFTAFGTCPMPVAGNVIDGAVEAGERRPRAV